MIEVTPEFGIVVRLQSLDEKNVLMSALFEALQVTAPCDQNEKLLSFGPSFGEEALEEFIIRLQRLGLEYWDDFFEFKGDYPAWVSFHVEYRDEGSS